MSVETKISIVNSTQIALNANETFLGTYEKVQGYSSVGIFVSVGVTTGTLTTFFSTNSDDDDIKITQPIRNDDFTITNGESYYYPVKGKYFKIEFSNGADTTNDRTRIQSTLFRTEVGTQLREKNMKDVPLPFLFNLGKIPGVLFRTFGYFKDSIQIADGEFDAIGANVLKLVWTPFFEEKTLFVSSNDVLDTATFMRVLYLDSNFEEFTVMLTLNGQTPVEVATNFYRLRGALQLTNISVGDVFFYTGPTDTTGGVPDDISTVQAVVNKLSGTFGEFLYSPKAGTRGFFTLVSTFVSGKQNGDAIRKLIVINNNGVIREGSNRLIPGGSSSSQPFTFARILRSGQTFTYRFSVDTNNMSIGLRIFLLEIDEDIFDSFMDKFAE